MREIQCFRDLEQFGIDALTGEACGYAMRLLCDVTAEGKRLIELYLGGTIVVREGTNWNGGSEADPHVGSVLLPREGFVGPFGAFCLLQTRSPGSMVVSLKGRHGDYPAEYTTDDIDRLRDLWEGADQSFEELFERWSLIKIVRYYARPAAEGTDRNCHAMTGRVA